MSLIVMSILRIHHQLLNFCSVQTMETSEKHSLFTLRQLLVLCLLCFIANVEALNKSVSAIYVFGDSTADPGNNNYIKTIAMSNFPPNGRDFPNKVPTGRFCNGKLIIDFIASYIGVKELVPPYLDPTLSDKELLTGISFASASTGFDPLTPSLLKVIPIPKQLKYFKEYKKRLEGVLGKQKAEEHIKNAAFFISTAGINDFVLNYFTVPVRRKSYNIEAYQQFLIQHVKEFIQNLLAEGAQKIGIFGVPPIGCLPIMITLHSDDPFHHRGCIEKYNSVVRDYNLKLQNELHLIQLNSSNHGAKIYYLDFYDSLALLIQEPEKLGFKSTDSGCCGTGYVETSILCNQLSPVCPDSSEYVFWDSIHPSEKAYYNVYMAVLPVIDSLINDI